MADQTPEQARYQAAHRWLREQLDALGRPASGKVQTVKDRPWSLVLRAPTEAGDVYCKANAPGSRHEPALLRELSKRWPGRVPEPLVADAHRGWLLLEDYGSRLDQQVGEEELVEIWQELLPRYAEIQLDSSRNPDGWTTLGVPDRRLARLPELLEKLLADEELDLVDSERDAMRALAPDVETCARELGDAPYSAALEHGDLHGGNVLVGRGTRWLFDWADASVSHPFCSLLITCNMATEDLESSEGRRVATKLRDAYLEPFTASASAAELREIFPVVLWLAHLGRALDWQHMLAGVVHADRASWHPHIATWLRSWVERTSWLRARFWP